MDIEAIKAADVTSTGTVVTTNGRIRAFVVTPSGTGGTAVVKDGGASGAELITINTPAVAGIFTISIPGGGLSFGTDVHATLTNVTALGILYADDAKGAVT